MCVCVCCACECMCVCDLSRRILVVCMCINSGTSIRTPVQQIKQGVLISEHARVVLGMGKEVSF